MDRPGVYIETSIVSYLAADPSRHPVTLRNQQMTYAWWTAHRHRYALYTSEFVINEAELGDPVMAKRRLALLSRATLLAPIEPVLEFAIALRQGIPLPAKAGEDALHVAMAVVYRLDALLTWDCTHIANPHLRSRMERVCARWGYALPHLCTPRDLP